MLLFCIVAPQLATSVLQEIKQWIMQESGWLYILSVAIFFIFCIYIMFSRFGDIKLGPDDAEPEYNNGSWFAMLFATGMGGGLLFFGVAEPVMHFISPPVGEAETTNAALEAMRITYFHWGLHAWAIYALVGLVFSYFTYRHKLPLLPRSALYPLIGDKIFGPLGHAIDIFAAIGTLFGLATSLGFGVIQINAGFAHVFNVPENVFIQVSLVFLITLIALFSLYLGLDKGVRRLSNVNIIMALVLLLFVFFVGPTVLLCKTFLQNLGHYLSTLVNTTFNMYAYEPKEEWFGGWTLFYWAWWIAWSPFVGMFIAKISRGRKIRDFIVGALFAPVGFTILWMTVFGNTSIEGIINNTMPNLTSAIAQDISHALFVFFEYLPLPSFLSIYALILLLIFFVSSLDSSALIINILTSGDGETFRATRKGSLIWAGVGCLMASILLVAGGLEILQSWLIVSAYPFMLVILVYCFCLFKQLREDYMLQSCVQTYHTSVQYSQANIPWQKRLQSLLHHPTAKEARRFLKDRVEPGLKELSTQMCAQGLSTDLKFGINKAELIIHKDELEDFSYGVHLRRFAVPVYADEENDGYYRAEVFLRQGGQRYDVLGYSKEQIIADALTQYERHLHFLYLAASETL